MSGLHSLVRIADLCVGAAAPLARPLACQTARTCSCLTRSPRARLGDRPCRLAWGWSLIPSPFDAALAVLAPTLRRARPDRAVATLRSEALVLYPMVEPLREG